MLNYGNDEIESLFNPTLPVGNIITLMVNLISFNSNVLQIVGDQYVKWFPVSFLTFDLR